MDNGVKPAESMEELYQQWSDYVLRLLKSVKDFAKEEDSTKEDVLLMLDMIEDNILSEFNVTKAQSIVNENLNGLIKRLFGKNNHDGYSNSPE